MTSDAPAPATSPSSPSSLPLHARGATGQAAAVASGEVTALALTEATLARIERIDPQLDAFTVVLGDAAREEAAERDRAQARGGTLGPLHGVPVAIKEENDVAGTVTTFGGFANRTPAAADGLVTARLRAAGAVVVGKTNMPEFGQHPFTESERHGSTRNPWDRARTPGGSSGGTAAAVAAGLVAVGIGGDGGGSIRIPSACCGLFGLKPTRGRVSTAPQPDLWEALGTVGPLTRSVLDSAVVYDVLRGNQPTDRYTVADPETSFTDAALRGTAGDVPTLRVAWSTRSASPGVRPDPEHVRAVEETAALLASLGHRVLEIDPRYPDPTAAFLPQFFSGVRAEAAIVEDPALLERRTRTILRLGRWVTPRVRDWALRQGERIADVVDARVFSVCDVLLTPTIAPRPPEVGVLDGVGAVPALLKDIPMVAYTAIWNVTGHPAAAVPSGFGSDGLPTSVQLVGRRGDETTLLALSAQLEAARGWADRWPSL